MKRSTDRILATHAGALPRPDDLKDMVFAKARGERTTRTCLHAVCAKALPTWCAVRSTAAWISSTTARSARPTSPTIAANANGFETRHFGPGEGPPPLDISGRDEKLFPEYFASGRGNTIGQAGRTQAFCVAPLTFTGGDALAADIDNLKSAVKASTSRARS